MLILIIVLVLVFGVGGGYYGYGRWGTGGGAGIGLGTVLVIVLACYIFGAFLVERLTTNTLQGRLIGNGQYFNQVDMDVHYCTQGAGCPSADAPIL